MALSSHHQRIITAVILLSLLVAALWFGGWAIFTVIAAASALGLWEFYSLFWAGKRRLCRKIAGIALSTGILFAAKIFGPGGAGLALLGAFWVVNLGFLILFSRQARSDGDTPDYRRPLIVLAGLIYLPMAMQFVFTFNVTEIVLVLLAAMATDTGAYYTGCTLGGPKIWPSVSPKKTWSGSFGGMIATVAVATAVGLLSAAPEAPLFDRGLLFAGVGLLLNIAAQFGDFFESALKRSVNVKDSGMMLPGHGGILDRIDSLLFVLPAYAGAKAVLPLF